MTLTLPRVGEDFAGYGLRAVLGRGGMSVVFEAENRRLGSKLALKVLAPELASDDVFRTRFLKESRMAASLNHPHVLPIYDVGPFDELLYIAMRYVAGADLRTVLKTYGRISPAQALLLIGQAGRALDAAHREGLIHRDVKPGNLLIERGGDGEPDHLYLADFGITKHTLSRSGLTTTGEFVGTIDYIAPEQIQDKEIDGRADLYSLGCVLYECLTGQVPFEKNVDAAVIWAHVEESPPPPTSLSPELPSAIDGVMARALAKDPDDRFDTCREFVAAVRDALATSAQDAAIAPAADVTADPPTLLSREVMQGPSAAPPAAAPPLRASNSSAAASAAGAGSEKGDTVIASPANRGGGGAPPGAPPAPRGAPIAEPPARDGGELESRDGLLGRHRIAAALLAVGVLAVAGGILALVLSSGGSSGKPHATSAAHVQSPISAALVRANQSITAKGLLPPSSCKAHSSAMVTCSQPVFSINNVTFQTFPSLGALYAAYVDQVKGLSAGHFRENFGECTQRKTSGEVGWNHNYQHPRSYSLAQLQSGHTSDDQAAGRLFCTFQGGQYHLMWTMNDGRLLGSLVGAPHDDAWYWWHGVHHAIDLGGAMPMSGAQTSGTQTSNGHM